MVGHPRGDGLFTGNVDDRVITTALSKFKKNTGAHISTHYEVFAKNYLATGDPRTSPLTVMDMIYYHVYGDLRLTTISGTTPSLSYVYRTNNNLPHISKVRDVLNDDFPFTQYLQNETDGQLGGYFAGTEDSTEYRNVNWFNDELIRGTGGTRFNLNSLGTLLVKGHAVKDISKELSNALKNEILSLINFIDDNEVTIPGLEFDADILGMDLNDISEDVRDPLSCTLLKYFFANPEYERLLANHPDTVRPSNTILGGPFKSDIRKATTVSEVVSAITKALFAKSTHRFVVGQAVEVLTARAGQDPGGVTIAQHLEEQGFTDIDPAYTTFVVSDVQYRGGNMGQPRYQITWVSEDGEEIVYPDRDRYPDDNNYNQAWLEERHLQKGYDPRFPEEGTVLGKKSVSKSIQHPAIIEYQRVLLDTFFCLQALVSMSQHKDFAFISEGVNLSPRVDRLRREFPNAGNPTVDYAGDFQDNDLVTGKHNKNKKQGSSLIAGLTKDRNYVTLSSIINTRQNMTNREQLDEFYSQDILMAEVNWLAQALISEGTVLIKSTKEKDLLAHLQYRDIPGSSGVLQTGSAPTETVFYQVEAPLLKDVIGQYIEVFNEMTIKNAFRGNATETMRAEASLAKAIWGSIKSRLTDALDIEGISPHILFHRLFASVEEIVQTQTMIKTHYPPQWVGTDTVEILRTDPAHLNQKIEPKFYNDKLQEYIDYLMSRYLNNHYLANTIVSTVEILKIQMAKDIDALRKFFINRIKNDDKKKRLIGTDFIFRPYPTVISILRSEISIPLQYRSEFAARGMDDQMRRELREEMESFGRQKIILPSTHPDRIVTEMEYDPDSALQAINNPNQLPMPAFYPRQGDQLNLANSRVATALGQLQNVILDSLNLPAAQRIFMNELLAHTFDATNGATFTAQQIDWYAGAPQVWDARESIIDPPQLLRVTQNRATKGIRFEIAVDNFVFNGVAVGLITLPLGIAPFPETDGQINWSDYNSLLFRKRTGTRFDADGISEPNNIYNRPGGAFTNPPELGDAGDETKQKPLAVFIKTEDIERLYAQVTGAPVAPVVPVAAVPAPVVAPGIISEVEKLIDSAHRHNQQAKDYEKAGDHENKRAEYRKKNKEIIKALELDVDNFRISDRDGSNYPGIMYLPLGGAKKIHVPPSVIKDFNLKDQGIPAGQSLPSPVPAPSPAPSPVPAAVSEPPAVDFEAVIPIIPEPDQIEKVEEIV